jgi:uncharacterized damage-inducible protein DinB
MARSQLRTVGQQELIEAYQSARRALMEALEGLENEDFLRPGAVGTWSVKDALAHITAWESEVVTALVYVENGKRGTPNIMTIDDIDEWNDEQYHHSARRTFEVIWDDFVVVERHVIEAIKALDDRTLADNRKFPWMEGEALEYIIYENAIWHEEEHAEDIRQWRDEVLGY